MRRPAEEEECAAELPTPPDLSVGTPSPSVLPRCLSPFQSPVTAFGGPRGSLGMWMKPPVAALRCETYAKKATEIVFVVFFSSLSLRIAPHLSATAVIGETEGEERMRTPRRDVNGWQGCS